MGCYIIVLVALDSTQLFSQCVILIHHLHLYKTCLTCRSMRFYGRFVSFRLPAPSMHYLITHRLQPGCSVRGYLQTKRGEPQAYFKEVLHILRDQTYLSLPLCQCIQAVAVVKIVIFMFSLSSPFWRIISYHWTVFYLILLCKHVNLIVSVNSLLAMSYPGSWSHPWTPVHHPAVEPGVTAYSPKNSPREYEHSYPACLEQHQDLLENSISYYNVQDALRCQLATIGCLYSLLFIMNECLSFSHSLK